MLKNNLIGKITQRFQKKNKLLPFPFLVLTACGGEKTDDAAIGDDLRLAEDYSFPLTGNKFVDATTQGSYWVAQNNQLTFAVAHGFNEETWNDINYVSEKLSTAMANVDYFTPVDTRFIGTFNNPTDAATAGATIVLSLDASVISAEFGDSAWAVGFYPNSPDVYYEHSAGDIFLNLNSAGAQLANAAYEPGGKGFMLLLHELGHALGLKHPHDDGGTGRLTYEQAGYANYDDQLYTVMAYDDEFGSVYNAPGTFMLGDALGLMVLYGVNRETNAGDTVYAFRDNDIRNTIWDAAGSDLIDLSQCQNDVFARLTQYYSDADIGIEYGYVTTNYGLTDTRTHWLLGEYEDLIGGAGNDILWGDENDNIIRGNGGHDIIDGYGGDDLLYGDAGMDEFQKSLGDGNDIILDFEVGVDICTFWTESGRDDTIARLTSNAYGEALYMLSDGSNLLLDGVQYSDYALIA